jgi:hypothetical protein
MATGPHLLHRTTAKKRPGAAFSEYFPLFKIAGIPNKIARREKHQERAMKSLQILSAGLLLSIICLWTCAYGQIPPRADSDIKTATPTTGPRTKTAPSLAQYAQGHSLRAVSLIVEPVDENKRILLPGNTRGEVRPEFDRGRVDDSFPLNGIQLQLRRSPERERAAEALADDLQRAGSPRFHQWLTAHQYAEQFGVAPEDIVRISEWLRAHGFRVHPTSPSRMTIDFSGTAGQVRETFGTEIHAVDVKGERHIANVRNPQIPAALAPAIEGIVSLDDFRPRPQYTFPIDGFTFLAVAPADLATVYQFNTLFSFGITG